MDDLLRLLLDHMRAMESRLIGRMDSKFALIEERLTRMESHLREIDDQLRKLNKAVEFLLQQNENRRGAIDMIDTRVDELEIACLPKRVARLETRVFGRRK